MKCLKAVAVYVSGMSYRNCRSQARLPGCLVSYACAARVWGVGQVEFTTGGTGTRLLLFLSCDYDLQSCVIQRRRVAGV